MSQPTVSIQDVIDYIDFLNNAKKLSNMYKESFEAYIKDKSLPLELRWKMWLDAPTDLKDKDPYVVQWGSLPKDSVGYDGNIWDAQKYETIYSVNLVSAAEQYEEIDVDALKEEILEYNLESYDYDW